MDIRLSRTFFILSVLLTARAWVIKDTNCSRSISDALAAAQAEVSPLFVRSYTATSPTLTQDSCPDDRPPLGITTFVTSTEGVEISINAASATSSPTPIDWRNEFDGQHDATVTSSNGTICASLTVPGSPLANAVSLYSEIPQGAFSADQLLQLGTVQTALGFLQTPNTTDFALTFYQDQDGRICTDSGIVPVCIERSYKGCDGWVHIGTALLIPKDVPQPTLQTLYDVPSADLAPWAKAVLQPTCDTTLLGALYSNPELVWNANLLTGFLDKPTLNFLNSTDAAVTVLAITQSGLEALYKNVRPDAAPLELPDGTLNMTAVYAFISDENSWAQVTAALAFNMLPRVYCMRELLQMEEVNTIYGRMYGANETLRFQQQGTLPADPVLASSNGTDGGLVWSAQVVCNSVMYVVNGFMGIPTVTGGQDVQLAIQSRFSQFLQGNATQIVGPPPTCTDTPYLKYNNSNSIATLPFIKDGGSPFPPENVETSSDGLSTGAIAGVAVGSVALLSLAAFGVMAWLKHRKRPTAEHFSHRVDDATLETGSVTVATVGSNHGTPISNSGVVSRQGSKSLPPNVIAGGFGASNEEWVALDSYTSSASDSSKTDSTIGPIGIQTVECSAPQLRLKLCLDEANKEPIQLGRGAYGMVYKGKLSTGEFAAVKVMAKPGVAAECSFKTEADILRRLQTKPNANVVQLYGVGTDSRGNFLLVMELMEGGDLREALSAPTRGHSMRWNAGGRSAGLDITEGLVQLHESRVIHRDLKSKNVLLTADYRAKIADVGLSAILSQSYLTADGNMGTLAWAAPEMILGRRCTAAVDIYALGVVLWELATGCMPRRGFIHLPTPDEGCPPELAQLISDCMHQDPRQRPSAVEVRRRILEIPTEQQPINSSEDTNTAQ